MPRLGSPEDRVLRNFLTKEAEKEAAKTNMMALLVTNCIPMSDETAARKWEGKVRKLFMSYLELEYGIKLPENTEKELDMMKYYKDKIKDLKPVLRRSGKGKQGNLVVSGLDSLKE